MVSHLTEAGDGGDPLPAVDVHDVAEEARHVVPRLPQRLHGAPRVRLVDGVAEEPGRKYGNYSYRKSFTSVPPDSHAVHGKKLLTWRAFPARG